MTKLQEMRLIALERANNRCEWPTCINYDQKLEMAHLVDIGIATVYVFVCYTIYLLITKKIKG